MYFINKKIVKTIANAIYRDATFEDNNDDYVIYDRESKDTDFTVSFSVKRDNPDDMFEFKHFTICVHEDMYGRSDDCYIYWTTQTLNRRELADKLLEIISRYEYLKEVSA